MPFRFFHRFRVLPGITVNTGKRGVSVSTGVPGVHVTSGTSGARVTVGLPGTGLFYTHDLSAGGPTPKQKALIEFADGLRAVSSNPDATPHDLAAALNRLNALGLTDDDLWPEARAFVEQL